MGKSWERFSEVLTPVWISEKKFERPPSLFHKCFETFMKYSKIVSEALQKIF